MFGFYASIDRVTALSRCLCGTTPLWCPCRSIASTAERRSHTTRWRPSPVRTNEWRRRQRNVKAADRWENYSLTKQVHSNNNNVLCSWFEEL